MAPLARLGGRGGLKWNYDLDDLHCGLALIAAAPVSVMDGVWFGSLGLIIDTSSDEGQFCLT